jgi:zinc transporter
MNDMSSAAPARAEDRDAPARGVSTPIDIEPKGLGVVPGLVWAFRIHADGSAEPLAVDQPIDERHDGWLWLHLNLADQRAAAALRDLALPPAALALLISHDDHQQLHAVEDCTYGVLADLVQRIDAGGDETGHLRFIMNERLLLSGRHHALKSCALARDTLANGKRRLPHVAALLELIVEHVGDAVDHLADELTEDIDEIEDRLALRTRDVERQKLAVVRRTAVRLHRQLSGLRVLFHRLERQETEGFDPALRIAAGRIAQRLDALDHEIVAMRERTRLLQEEITALTAEETNRHLYVLSILTTLVLPPTLVTGVFGMNTKGLPFTDNENAFLWACVLMVASAVAVYLLMRRVGVFKL